VATEKQDYEQLVKELFELCKLSLSGSEQRTKAVVLKGLHELSLAQFIHLVSHLVTVGCRLIAGFSQALLCLPGRTTDKGNNDVR